jgi:hypothetical protein
VVSTDSEPVYEPGVHQLLLKDEFDTYQSLTSAVLGGWRCSNRSTSQDVTTNPQGACRVITGGYDSVGKAIRLVYDGISNGAGQEAHAWGRPSMPDNQAGRPGKTFYMSYYFRITPGRGALDVGDQRVQVKWLELWRTDESDRAQFSTAYSFCTNDLPSTLWNFYARAGGAETCQGGQVRPPFASEGAGEWQRATHKYVTQSAAGARDGIGQMWIDGKLIVSVAAGYCGVAVPNNAGARPQNWCENADLDSFFTNEQVKSITLGGVMTGPLWPFTIDWDHVTIWRDR